MTTLTQEYLDKSLKNLPTKQDVAQIVDEKIKPLATKQDLDDAVENLARTVNQGFEEQQKYLEEKLDVRERMTALEKDMARIKEALHIK